MPRVTLCKNKYIEKDAAKYIEGKTRERGKQDKQVAQEIGISPPAYCSRKKDGKCMFNYLDLVKIINFLQFTDEEIIKLMRGRFR